MTSKRPRRPNMENKYEIRADGRIVALPEGP